MQILKITLNIIFATLCSLNVVRALEPYPPEFSLSNIYKPEPPPLPQVYTDIPSWDYYTQAYHEHQATNYSTNDFLPQKPMIMEVCAIIGQTRFYYQDSLELMSGCYRGDSGLSLLQLQPYEYWAILSTLKDIRLMPSDYNAPMNATNMRDVRILINYKTDIFSPQSYKTIELGAFDSPYSYISINGQVFKPNIDVMQVIYGMIYDLQEEKI